MCSHAHPLAPEVSAVISAFGRWVGWEGERNVTLYHLMKVLHHAKSHGALCWLGGVFELGAVMH